jgi:hypothetical protein
VRLVCDPAASAPGIRWLFADSRRNTDPPTLGALAREAFRTVDVVVYELS